jgi:lipoprotein signal peptidase
MKLIKSIAIAFFLIYVLELTTLHIWSHPFFVLLLAGIVGGLYDKLFTKPVKRRERHVTKIHRPSTC